jgi:hypothetical protein
MRCITLLAASILFAPALDKEKNDEKPKDDVKVRIEKYLENGKPGVFYSETHDTKEGDFLRLFVVGRSTISTALGADEGLEIAQERAEENAKIAFVSFLNGKVTVRKTSTNQIILSKEGEEGAGDETVREKAKKVEKRTREFEETAGAPVRGLKVVAFESKAKEKSYVIVYRWSACTAEAAGKINDKLNKPKIPGEKPNEGGKKSGSSDKPKGDNKEIPNKKVIIDD